MMQKDMMIFMRKYEKEHNLPYGISDWVIMDLWRGVKVVIQNAKEGKVETFKGIRIKNYIYFQPRPLTIYHLTRLKKLRERKLMKNIKAKEDEQPIKV